MAEPVKIATFDVVAVASLLAQTSTAQASTAQTSTAQTSTAQTSTAQASTAQASTAQKVTAQEVRAPEEGVDGPIISSEDIITRINEWASGGSGDVDQQSRLAVDALNRKSADIAAQIEREVGKYIRDPYKVQANVHFVGGSIIMSVTIVILSWLGTAAVDAAKEEIQKRLSEAVRYGVNSVFTSVLAATGLTNRYASPSVSVTLKAPLGGVAEDSDGKARSSWASSLTPERYLRWILIGVVALFLLQGLIWLDQHFTITPRGVIPTSIPVTAPAVATATAAPAVP